MQQIRQVLRRKQAQLAQLTKEIQLLEQAEEKLREIAPLLAEAGDEDEGSLLVEVEDEVSPSGSAAKTASASAGSPAASRKPVALRWP